MKRRTKQQIAEDRKAARLRKAKSRQEKRDQGLVPLPELWIKAEHKQAIIDIVNQYNAE